MFNARKMMQEITKTNDYVLIVNDLDNKYYFVMGDDVAFFREISKFLKVSVNSLKNVGDYCIFSHHVFECTIDLIRKINQSYVVIKRENNQVTLVDFMQYPKGVEIQTEKEDSVLLKDEISTHKASKSNGVRIVDVSSINETSKEEIRKETESIKKFRKSFEKQQADPEKPSWGDMRRERYKAFYE